MTKAVIRALLVVVIPVALLVLAAPAFAGQNILSWKDNSTTETTFYIVRKLGPRSGTASWYFRAQVGAGVTTYTDTGLVVGQTYCYKVRAVSLSGVSPYSNEAQGTAKISLTTCGLQRLVLSDGTVVYKWVCV